MTTRLGELEFLDTGAIDDGDQFPETLLKGLLEAHVVVIFATQIYRERRFCRQKTTVNPFSVADF